MPHRTSHTFNDPEAAAVNQVVSAMSDHYKAAIGKGHSPADSWLIPNSQF
jgi:hypothetical protein